MDAYSSRARLGQVETLSEPERQGVYSFVRYCQVMAGELSLAPRLTATGAIERLLCGLRRQSSTTSALVILGITAQMVVQIMTRAGELDGKSLPDPLEALTLSMSQLGMVVGRAHGATNDAAARPGGEPVDRRIEYALEFLMRQCSQTGLRLNDAAAAVNLSPSRLSHLLKRQTGASFTQHLRLIRLTAAVELLRTTPLSVKEIVARVGYAHVSSFDRDFRNAYRCRPSEVRGHITRSAPTLKASRRNIRAPQEG